MSDWDSPIQMEQVYVLCSNEALSCKPSGNSVDWNDGMERWSGVLDWTTGVPRLLYCIIDVLVRGSNGQIITVSSMVTSHAS